MSVGLVGFVPTAAVVAALSFLGGVTARAETAERILDVPFVSQSENLCGGAAVAMVLRYWGERGVFAEDFSPFLNASGSGIATDQLVEAVEARGTSAFSFHPDEASARHHLDVGRPLVVLLEVGPDRYHYVVLVGWSAEKDEVIVHDPVWGAFRRFESEAFRERWSGSGRWALLILPDESGNEPSLADSEPLETQRQHPCDVLEAEAVVLAREGDLDAAERRLAAALERCPDDPGALRELAGVRLLQSRNDAARNIAERVVSLDPTDEHAWRTLATARFLEGDGEGALLAWNQVGEPVIDLTFITGTERTPPRLFIDRLGLDPKNVLEPDALSRAQRRLSDFPALSFSALRYRPVPGGLAEIEVAAVERPRFVDGPIDVASRSLRTVVDRELSLEVNNAARRGERLAASWRFWEERPRVAVSLEVPSLFGLPGVGRLHAEWDRQTYATASRTMMAETRKSVRLGFSDWANGRSRWEVDFGADAWDERGGFLALGGGLEKRFLEDRLSTRVGAEGFVGPSDSFATAAVEAYWRSSSQRSKPVRLLARARLGTTSNEAPLALWQGAGVGRARPALLRAHPLLAEGVVSGEVFGRHLLSGGIELERFRATPVLVRVGFAVFVDAAKSWETLSGTDAAHVDVGAGLRLSLASYGTFRLDIAHGLRDGNVAASLGFQLGWPRE